MQQCTPGSSPPGDPKAAQAQKDAAVKDTLAKIKQKFLVMSGKGGVGKTSVSVNIAMALANRGYKVGILDVDIHGPDVPRMLGLRKSMLDLNANRKLMPLHTPLNLTPSPSRSLSASKDDAIIWRGPLKHSVIRQFISAMEPGASWTT